MNRKILKRIFLTISMMSIIILLFVYGKTEAAEETGLHYLDSKTCDACWNNGQVYQGVRYFCDLGGSSCQPNEWFIYCKPVNGCGI